MAGDLEIRRARQEDAHDILNLIRQSLGEGKIPRSEEYWRWKHEDNPFGPSSSLLAYDNRRLVGLRVFMRWNWQANGRVWPAVRAVDTATHPAWRGRGIFTRLTLALAEEMSKEGVTFIFNTPNGQSLPGYLKMGWKPMGRLSAWVRPMRLRRLPDGNSLEGTAREQGDYPPRVCAPAVQLFQHSGLQEFLDSLQRPDGCLSTPRNVDYLRWRYGSIPGLTYRAVWEIAGVDGAVLIYRTKTVGRWHEVRLCEVLVGDSLESRRRGRSLLRTVLKTNRAHYATAMGVRGAAERSMLVRTGFFPAPRVGPVMTIRPLSGITCGPDPLRRSSWNLSSGDLELF